MLYNFLGGALIALHVLAMHYNALLLYI